MTEDLERESESDWAVESRDHSGGFSMGERQNPKQEVIDTDSEVDSPKVT